MSIPDFQSLMLPFMEYVADGKEHSLREIIDFLASHFGLNEAERKQLSPSGKQSMFNNRVGWTRTYLKKAGLIKPTKKAHFQITTRGMECLRENPPVINVKFLKKYPEFIDFHTHKKGAENVDLDILDETSPEEALEMSYQKIRQDLAVELLEAIKKCSPEFFERLVVELLVNMGYGGSRKDAGEAIGQSGDEGIDGIIKEDRLGDESGRPRTGG